MAAVVTVIAVGIALYLNHLLKKSRYDENKNKVFLDSIRHSFETQMYTINDRLVQNEERWRDVNHLLLRDEYKENESIINTKRRTYLNEFLKANGINENDLIVDSRLIFVLTPFHDKYAEDYEVIKKVCSEAGFKCVRGDETFFKGDIFPEMLKLIVKARLIIANINGRNPNVFYELGISQALDKAVLLVSSEPDKLPIDIKSKRFLIYQSYKELQELIRTELMNF